MNRSGFRYWKALLSHALVVLVVVGTTQAQPAAAQNDGSAPDKQETALHYSLYWENFKNQNYRDAMPDLRWILERAPGFPRDKDQNFERAVTAYEALAEEAASPEEKRALLDSALVMFDRAVPTLRGVGAEIDEFEWTRNKGRFIQKHLQDLDDRKEEAIGAYRKAYQIDPMRIDAYYLDVMLSDSYTKGDIGGVLDFLRELDEKRGDQEEIQNLVKKYFTVIPPDEQIAFLEKQLAADPENLEIIKQLFDLYEKEKYRDKMMEMAPRLLQMDPTPEILRLLTRMYIEDGEVDKAAELFVQLESTPNADIKAEDYYNMGIAQQGLGKYSSAREYFRKALQVNPNFNRANQAIADLYATVVSECGVQDRKDKAVFWLVADAYQRAGNAAGAARYRSVFPSAEDIFFFNEWTEGASTSVSYTCRGLTISGTTIIRKSN